eukprot:CAMPEP_0178899364 /NCGR_PEP_ID=MMETSP0786-20121207/2854_1 /TAXON_ID=186022 /ORGANISM="Thalassionema frauenfeldii, Strain CCMP 1798" /LENGTH=64 /DNA_ID=CAMNT_0020570203 /DNA_START=350 /DNA_END=544 /DNA_ORIENTATION=+
MTIKETATATNDLKASGLKRLSQPKAENDDADDVATQTDWIMEGLLEHLDHSDHESLSRLAGTM